MNIHEGDTVKAVNVQTQHSHLEGRTGTVLAVSENAQCCRVNLEWTVPEGSEFRTQGVLTTLFFDELELVQSANEAQQVQGIAEALKKEEVHGWEDEDYQAVAASLYKSGVRFDG